MKISYLYAFPGQHVYSSHCFYQYSSHYGDHDKGTSLSTILYIRPVTDEWPSLFDRIGRLSEEDVFKDYKPYPQNPIPLSIERIYDYTEEQYRQYLDEQRRRKELNDRYWARQREIEEEKRKQALMTGKVYHKVEIIAHYWKDVLYDSRKDVIMKTYLIRHDELMAVISGGMSARKAWLSSHSGLLYDEIIDVEISYNLRRAYDKDGHLLSNDY